MTKHCPICQSTHVIKVGFTPKGYQQFRCKDCGKYHSDSPNKPAHQPIGFEKMTWDEAIKRVDPKKLVDRKIKAAEYQRQRRAKKKKIIKE